MVGHIGQIGFFSFIRFETELFSLGPFSQWNEQILSRIKNFLQKLPEFENSDRISKIAETLRNYSENELQKSEYMDIPVVFSVNDIAPKNTLVHKGKGYFLGLLLLKNFFLLLLLLFYKLVTKEITGIVDWEWAAFS